MTFKLQRYTRQQIMEMMGINDHRTYKKYVNEKKIGGTPKHGLYDLNQVVNIVVNYEYLFIEPLDLEQILVIYRKHKESVSSLRKLLQN